MMRKFFGLALALGLIAFVIGFWRFAESVRAPEHMPPPPEADAIVALTGGSLERLETGVRLLEEKKGERLLISGVNRVVTDAELFHALNAPMFRGREALIQVSGGSPTDRAQKERAENGA
jgi:hypothetical protein